MKPKIISFFFFIVACSLSQAQNKSSSNTTKTLDEFETCEKIKQLVRAEKTKEIWDLCSENFKSKVTFAELENTISTISESITENNIGKLSISNSFNQTTVKSGIIRNTYTQKMIISPKNLKEIFGKSFFKSGHELKIVLLTKDDDWYLDELSFVNKYADYKKNENWDLNDFFHSHKFFDLVMSIRNELKTIMLGDKASTISFKNELINYVNNSNYLDFDSFQDDGPNVFRHHSQFIYSMQFQLNKEVEYGISNAKNIEEGAYSDTLMISFVKNESNLIIVSYGDNYGIYKVDSLEPFIKIITDKIKTNIE